MTFVHEYIIQAASLGIVGEEALLVGIDKHAPEMVDIVVSQSGELKRDK